MSYGIMGAILAAPVIASLKEIIRYLYLKIRGLPVEVDIPVEPASIGTIRFLRKRGSFKREETVAKENILAEKGIPKKVENENI